MNILIVEDDKDIVELIQLYLENEGYHVYAANNGENGLKQFAAQDIHLCILDIMIPKVNGYEVAKQIRSKSKVPIIFLSAKGQYEDIVLGLNLGADDYITKPFNPLELIARVKSALRRTYEMRDENAVLEGDGIRLEVNSLSCFIDGREIVLTPTEYKILSLFLKNPNRIFNKVQIYEYINGECFESLENTIQVHMSNLRDKIENNPKEPKFIKTVRGLGYKLEK
ncbi:MAG: response regulator transcription factor [Anaerorhabdus sp.]|nr:response regulator transcription factor [Anaerorhabdus sp.]MEA4874937.1 response regulator transcription factor [Anaerorhabdus sp.]